MPEESLYKYLRRKTDAPRGDVVERIARVFGKTAVELRYGLEPQAVPAIKKIPLLDANALRTMRNIDQLINAWQGPTVYVPAFESQGAIFAVTVTDNACTPKIEKGDLLIVDQASEAEPGDFVLAYVAATARVVCRRFRPLDEAATAFVLIATNIDFPPISVATLDDGYVVGRVRKVVKDV